MLELLNIFSPLPDEPNTTINQNQDAESLVKELHNSYIEYRYYFESLSKVIIKRFVKLGIICLIMMLIINIFIRLPWLKVRENDKIGIYIMIAVFFISLFFIFFVWLWSNVELAKLKLDKYKERYEDAFLETVNGFRKNLRQRFRLLITKSIDVFEDDKKSQLFDNLKQKASDILSVKADQNNITEINLDEASSYLDAMEKLINLEQKYKRQQKIWEHTNILLIFFYISILIILMIFSYNNETLQNFTIPFFSIPFWTIVSGGLGSIAAILYKFYKPTKITRFDLEFRWLIARPIIGIVMSMIAYLSLQAGLVILGSSSSLSGENNEIAKGTALIFCFIVSFNDRALEGIVEKILGYTIGKNNENQEEKSILQGNDNTFNLEKDKKLK